MIGVAAKLRAVLSQRDEMAIKVLSQAEVSSIPWCGKVELVSSKLFWLQFARCCHSIGW